MVEEVARSRFTFLRDAKARTEVALGDARLLLEREPDQHFDTLVLDAFSGDSIPVHLLTLEAFQCYFRHLRSGGLIVVHVSNQYLDLRPVLAGMASQFKTRATLVESRPQPERDVSLAEWILITSNDAFLNQIGRTGRGRALAASGRRYGQTNTAAY